MAELSMETLTLKTDEEILDETYDSFLEELDMSIAQLGAGKRKKINVPKVLLQQGFTNKHADKSKYNCNSEMIEDLQRYVRAYNIPEDVYATLRFQAEYAPENEVYIDIYRRAPKH